MDGLDSDEGRVTQVIIWFLFIAAIFAVCARLGTKWVMTHAIGLDDQLIISAQTVYLAQCIAASQAASAGFASGPDSKVSGNSLSAFLKSEYASVPLLILALAIIKLSNYTFIKQLSPIASHRKAAFVLIIIVGIWASTSIVTGLLECAIPTPWDYTDNSRCINRMAWWTYVAVLNILTDLGLVALYVAIVSNLQVSFSKKTVIVAGFLSRLLVVGITAAQLAVSQTSSNITSSQWLPLLLNQAVLSSSVITACVPYLKPFMRGLQSGINRVDNVSPQEDELAYLPNSAQSYASDRTGRRYQEGVC